MSFWHFDFTVLPASSAYDEHREFMYFHDGYTISDTPNPDDLPKVDDRFLELISSQNTSFFDEFLTDLKGRYDLPKPIWGDQVILTKNGCAENNIKISGNEMSLRFSLKNLDLQDFFFVAKQLTSLDVFYIFNDGTLQSIEKPPELFQKLLNSTAFERVST